MRSWIVWLLCLPLFSLRAWSAPAELAPPPLPDPPFVVAAAAIEAAARVTAETYPDADAVVIADYTRVAYQPDGTSLELNEEYTKVLTEKGKRDARTRSFGFMTHYGRVFVLAAEIIRPDGTRIPIDVKAQSREMVEPSQMGSNIYDPNHKVLQLALPGLEVGDMTRLVVADTTVKARVPDTWSDYAVFEHTYPILSLTYQVLAPAARPLAAVRLRSELPGKVAYEAVPNATGTLHTWTVRDVPQAFPEPNMPDLYTVVQRLLVSTITDWRDISRWYWTLCAPRIEATTDAMRAEVDRLVDGAATRDERIRRIFTFVSQNIRYMGITPEAEAPGYEPHDVSMTFDNRYGVCRDKAALLVAMLRMAGITAYPVIIHVGPRKDLDVPQPYFNHAIVAVERDGLAPGVVGAARYQLMDPTDENTRDLLPGYLRNKSFLVAHPDGETLLDSGPAPAEDNLVRIRTTGRLASDDALTLDVRIEFEGVNDNAYRSHLSRLKPEERRRLFEGLVRARVAGATLTDFTLEPADLADTGTPLAATLHCVAPAYPVVGEGAVVVAVPWLGGAVGYANWVLGRTGLSQRRFPLDTDPTCGVEENVEIDLGSRVGAVRAMPGEVSRRSEGLLFEQQVAMSESGMLQASSRFHIRAAEFSPEAYLGLREDLKEMEFARRRRPVYEPLSAGTEADVRILSDDTVVELTGPQSWTSVTHSRKRILTYSGKKGNSELKLGFNPAWQKVELVACTVTAVDGTVKEVAPREVNVMDAAWVGGAPRYPAERTMVVSLPGVEIGSVIDTTIKATSSEMPFFSMRASLQGREPVDAASLAVSYPAELALRVVEPTSTPAVAVAHQRTEADGRITHRWSVANVPPLKPEDDLPPAWAFVPTVFLSTGDWSAYGADLRRRVSSLSKEQPAARAKAAELVAGATTEADRIRILRDFVARAIRVAGPDFTALPLDTLSAADTTLRDGYGHRADVAILLLALLDGASIPAEPLLVGGGAPVLSSLSKPLWECPQRALFDTVLVRVPSAAGAVWLNDTDQYAALGASPHELRPAMTLAAAPEVVRVADDLRSRGDDEWTLDVAADGTAKIVNAQRFWGPGVGVFRKQYREMPPEERRRHAQELVAGISQSAVADGELLTDVVAYPGVRRLGVTAARYAVREGQTLHLTLPGIEENVLGLRSERRTSPLYRGTPSEFVSTHTVLLPKETRRLLVTPPSVEVELPSGFGHVAFTTESHRRDDGRLEVKITRRIALESAVASADLYPALLALNRRFQHPEFRTLVVELGE